MLQHAVTARCATSARGVVRCSLVHRWLNGDEVFTSAILMGPSSQHEELRGGGGEGVITDEAVWVVAVDGVEGGNFD
jgi:hypothetical protein